LTYPHITAVVVMLADEGFNRMCSELAGQIYVFKQ
jgi:hypothetical protein